MKLARGTSVGLVVVCGRSKPCRTDGPCYLVPSTGSQHRKMADAGAARRGSDGVAQALLAIRLGVVQPRLGFGGSKRIGSTRVVFVLFRARARHGNCCEN